MHDAAAPLQRLQSPSDAAVELWTAQGQGRADLSAADEIDQRKARLAGEWQGQSGNKEGEERLHSTLLR